MNKHSLKYLLLFISCLFITNSCTNDDQLIEVQTKNNEVKNKFSVFYKNNNIQSKGNNLSIDYPKGFAILLQKYDSVQQTNLSGLVNTSNEIVWDKNLRLNFIKNASEAYVETRVFSQTMVNNKGDISLIFPKIFNNQVIDLIVAELHDEETQVHFYILDKNSSLYHQSIQLFQERFENIFLKKNAKSPNGGFDCGYGTLPPCNLDGPIIVGGGDSGGGFCCWGGENGGEIGGGGCPKYDMYVAPDSGGGGNGDNGEIPLDEVVIKAAIKDKPFALIDVPCDIIKQWLNTAKHSVSSDIIAKLNNISKTITTTGTDGSFSAKDVARLQDINNTYSTVVNMDYFPVTIDKLPPGTTAEQLLNHIRTNINNFIDTDTVILSLIVGME